MAGKFEDIRAGKWRVEVVAPGEGYGNGLVYDKAEADKYGMGLPLVRFHDMSQDGARFPGGQFVADYFMSTLLDIDGYGGGIDGASRFELDADIPAWHVEHDDLEVIREGLWSAYDSVSGRVDITLEQKKSAYLALFEYSHTVSELFELIDDATLEKWIDERFADYFADGLTIADRERLSYCDQFNTERDIALFGAYLRGLGGENEAEVERAVDPLHEASEASRDMAEQASREPEKDKGAR